MTDRFAPVLQNVLESFLVELFLMRSVVEQELGSKRGP
jgi:hypothetical protein